MSPAIFHTSSTAANAFFTHFRFQNDQDLDIVSELTDEAGLYKLEEEAQKAYEAAGHGQENDQSFDPNRPFYSLYSPSDPEFVRKHLESGILIQLFEKYEAKLFTDDLELFRHPGNILILLAACAMQLGCTIPDKHHKILQKIYMCAELAAEGVEQMKAALIGPTRFQNGQPYRFNSPGLVETANLQPATPNAIGVCGLNVHGPGTLFFRPPKGSKMGLMEAKADFKKQQCGEDVCGGCGAKETPDGNQLLSCGACKTRKYCSKECQKKQWKVHKGDCAELRPGAGGR